jgi:hypothetical protein
MREFLRGGTEMRVNHELAGDEDETSLEEKKEREGDRKLLLEWTP